MSDLLKKFYVAYLAWIDAGAPDGKPFERCWGLCTNLRVFCDNRTSNCDDQLRELVLQFEQAGLDLDIPFDSNSATESYSYSSERKIHHLNPKRTQWVRGQVAKIKEEASS